MNYPHLAARVFNTPLLIHPQKLDAIVAGLGSRLLGSPVDPAAGQGVTPTPGMFSTRRGEQADRGYRIVDGVAVISVSGALVHRSQFLMAESTFLLGYDDLAGDLDDAMANPDVHAVLQVYDTPGGEAQGAFEYAARVSAHRGKKPMVAICDGMAASAGYLGACAADEVVTTTTGYAGSIGVVMRHVDFSRALANDGIAVTHIFAGDHKVDGNPFEPLPVAVRADFQAEIDALMGMFVDSVVANRRMSADAVRRTQARCFQGVAAVASGLADRISTTDQLISELAAQRARSYPAGPAARSNANDKGASMSGIPQGGPQAAAPGASPALTQDHVDRARAEGRQEGITAERERASGIFAHEAAAGRTALAIQCVSTGLNLDQAGAILAASPAVAAAASAASGNNGFAAVMAGVGNPDVTGIEGGGTDTPRAQEAAVAGQIVALFRGGK